MIRKSLTFRIVALSGIWIFIALLATALLLFHYYQEHIEKHYDAHVFMHLEEMVVASSLTPDGELVLSSHPSDPRFDIDGSGWYWEIVYHGEVLAKSHSLGKSTLNLAGLQTTEGLHVHEIVGPGDQSLRVQTLEIPAGPAGEQLTLAISAPLLGITEDVIDIAEHMLMSFIVLGIGLVVAVVLQVKVALKPLRAISSGISKIREGKQDKLHKEYPEDVQLLVDELNNLIDHNAVLLKRARNQLGDLAHSIKNPLTVINNEARALDAEQRQLIVDQTSDITKSFDRYLSRARVSGSENVLGTRSHIRSVAEDLAFAMKRIHGDSNIVIDISCIGDCSFRGESQDLEEMLGNLMDNACKWASSRIVVRCGPQPESQRCRLTVDDDGPGIPENEIPRVLQRGQRLDDSVQGHGLGLSIVQDIVELYGGKLTFRQSEHGGLCAELDLPGA